MNNLKNILKEQTGTLMVVFPHPDDESVATGGLLLEAKRFGWKTIVVTLTTGQMGQCFVDKRGKDLATIRLQELKRATKILKVDKLIIGDFFDSKIKDNSSKVKRWLKTILNNERPTVVVTYDHSGFTGHPDHISLSVDLLNLIKDLKNRPDLFWVSAPELIANIIYNKKTLNYYLPPTHFISYTSSLYSKVKAILRHRSQDVGNMHLQLYLYLAIFRREWYYKVDLNKKYKYKFVYFNI